MWCQKQDVKHQVVQILTNPSKRKFKKVQHFPLFDMENHGCAWVPNAHPRWGVCREIPQREPDQTQGMWCVDFGATELAIHWVVPMIWQIGCTFVRSVP